MKLTNREKVLLIVLAVVIFLSSIYNFLITPAFLKIKNLNKQLEITEEKVNLLKKELNLYNKLTEEYNSIRNNIMLTNKSYYTDIIQEKIIILIKDFIDKSNITVSDINFEDLELADIKESNIDDSEKSVLDMIIEKYTKETVIEKEEKKEEKINTDKMSLTLDFSGTYNQLLAFINLVENNDKRIIIKNIEISKNEYVLIGSITLDIYTIPTIFNEFKDKIYYEFDYDYGKENPFY